MTNKEKLRGKEAYETGEVEINGGRPLCMQKIKCHSDKIQSLWAKFEGSSKGWIHKEVELGKSR